MAREVIGSRAETLRSGPGHGPAPFSATMIVGALVLPLVRNGIADESMTRRPSRPRTFSAGSTTAMSSVPILQVPTGW